MAALAIGAPSAVRRRPRTTCVRPNGLTSNVRLPRRPQCALSFARSLAPSPLAAPRRAGSEPGPIAALVVMLRETGPKIVVRLPGGVLEQDPHDVLALRQLAVSMSSVPSSMRSGQGWAAANSLTLGSGPMSRQFSAAPPSGTDKASAPSSSTTARNRPPPTSAAFRPKRIDAATTSGRRSRCP